MNRWLVLLIAFLVLGILAFFVGFHLGYHPSQRLR